MTSNIKKNFVSVKDTSNKKKPVKEHKREVPDDVRKSKKTQPQQPPKKQARKKKT